MKKYLWFCMGIIMLFSSCTVFEPDLENLLEPPKLTAKQREIDMALRNAIGTSDFTLNYPMRGDYRSAFVFADIDKDGADEAIVFYKTDMSATPRMLVLGRTDSGGWEMIDDLPGSRTRVASVSFASVLDRDKLDIIVEWGDFSSDTFTAIVYHEQEDGRIQNVYSENGELLLLVDSGGDMLSEIVILGGTASGNPTARLASRNQTGSIITSAPTRLNPDAEGFLKLEFGRISGGKPALFIDERASGSRYASEVLLLENLRLSNMTQADGKSVFETTLRETEVYSEDILRDGFIQLPVERGLPELSGSASDRAVYAIDYYKPGRDAFEYSRTAYINRLMGYRIYSPAAWNTHNITIKPSADFSEWKFYVYEDLPDETAVELFRIKVSSTRDYTDRFEREEYTAIAQKGVFNYSIYITDSKHPAALTAEEIKALFELI